MARYIPFPYTRQFDDLDEHERERVVFALVNVSRRSYRELGYCLDQRRGHERCLAARVSECQVKRRRVLARQEANIMTYITAGKGARAWVTARPQAVVA
jgi:hypothetical protein